MKEIFKRHPRYAAEPDRFESLPDVWVKCPRCDERLYVKQLEEAYQVCTKCRYHFPVSARTRLQMTLDDDSFQEYDSQIRSGDPLRFASLGEPYARKLEQYEKEAAAPEAFLFGTGRIEGQEAVVGVTEFKFCGGAMGAAFGEKVARAIELAASRSLPLILFSNSGGARMQEGAISLLQMAKVLAALDRFKETTLPYLSVMTDPCLGGTTASYAMMGDVNIAEPGAYIGFAGRRVIEQTMRQRLPANAATAEFLQQHGMVDMVVGRAELPSVLARLLRLYVTGNPSRTERRLAEQHA
jgi:acetyl-CoA carboxylase carboxyl transferase subunit beta